MGEREDAAQVRSVHAVHLFNRQFPDVTVYPADAGVVHQDIYPAPFVEGLPASAFCCIGLGHVTDGQSGFYAAGAEFAGRLLAERGVVVDHGDTRSLAPQSAGNPISDAGGRAGYDGYLIVETRHVRLQSSY